MKGLQNVYTSRKGVTTDKYRNSGKNKHTSVGLIMVSDGGEDGVERVVWKGGGGDRSERTFRVWV